MCHTYRCNVFNSHDETFSHQRLLLHVAVDTGLRLDFFSETSILLWSVPTPDPADVMFRSRVNGGVRLKQPRTQPNICYLKAWTAWTWTLSLLSNHSDQREGPLIVIWKLPKQPHDYTSAMRAKYSTGESKLADSDEKRRVMLSGDSGNSKPQFFRLRPA